MQPFERSDPAHDPTLRDPCPLRRLGHPLAFSAEEEDRIERLLSRYPTREAAILPMLWMIQDRHGWIPEEAVSLVAERCGVPPSHVYGVVSFYTMFRREPGGRHQLQICTNLSCQLMGAEHLLDCLRRRLGIGPGETTADGLFTLNEVECLAACEMAPVVQVDDEFHGPLDDRGLGELLDGLRARAAKEGRI